MKNMYFRKVIQEKFLFLFFSFFMILLTPNSFSQCPNADFSMGNFTNWTGSTGMNSAGDYSSVVNGIVQGTTNSDPFDPGRQTIIDSTGTDPNTGNALSVLPPGGSSCARLGNANSNYESEKLSYTLAVNSSNCIFTYQFAVVLEDPGHTAVEQPKFTIYVKDASGNVVDPTCGIYEVSASAGIDGFQDATAFDDGEQVRWKDWTTVGIDLSAYIGQNITIEFTTYDCAQGGHFGYAYISCSCGSLQLSQQCTGTSSTVTAPAGFSEYSWSTGETTQSVTYNNPVNGTIVSCVCTSVQGCNLTLQTTLFTSPPIHLGSDTIICTPAVLQLDAGSGFSSYLWSTGDTTQQINVSSSAAYSVTASQTDGCQSVDTIQLGINLVPGFNLGDDTTYYCQGSDIYLDAGNFFDSYLWSTGDITSQTLVDSAGMYYVTVTSLICPGTNADSIYVAESVPPVADAGTSDTICPDACTLLTASGGSNYSWNNGIDMASTNVCPAVSSYYTVTVYNSSGCPSVDSVFVFVLPALSVNISHTNAGCNQSDGTATVSVSGGSESFSYLWNTIPPQTTATAIDLAAGTYTFTVTDSVTGCSSSGTATISNIAAPNVSVQNIVDANCGMNNGSININTTGGSTPYTYQWNSTPPQTTQALTNVPPGTYCVTVTDQSGCSVSVCGTILAEEYSAPEICMVSVDTASNHNIVVWEKPVTNGIDKYYIYRESSVVGVYNLIGTQNYSDLSTFIDTSSNSLQQPYRYELAINDTCGTTSAQSSYHQTIHLTINSGISGQWNLIWNNYEGFSFSTYNIYRGNLPGVWTLLNSVASNVNSYTDLAAPSGIVYYMIEAVNPTPCNPSLKEEETLSSTISNIANSNNVGINECCDGGSIQVYPNPSKGTFTLSFDVQTNKTVIINILNSPGQIVHSEIMNNNSMDIDLSSLSKGIYTLKLIADEKSYFRKIVIE